jgi:hypothetical protein
MQAMTDFDASSAGAPTRSLSSTTASGLADIVDELVAA